MPSLVPGGSRGSETSTPTPAPPTPSSSTAPLTNPISDLITTPAAAAQNLRLLDAPVLLYAHSHQAAHWQTPDASDRPRRRQPRLEVPVTLDPAHLALLNPGAVTHDHRWLQLQLDDGRPTTATWRKAPATPAA